MQTTRVDTPQTAPDASGALTYSYAFQPIVDVPAREVFAFEALIRGAHNEPAGAVFARVGPERLHQFDHESRLVAIRQAALLGMATHLSVNALPRGLRAPAEGTLSLNDVLAQSGFPPNRLILEVTEGEIIDDQQQFTKVIDEFRRVGIKVAIDDFGAGYSGLNLLAAFQPDMIKLDMNLIRGVESSGPRQSIVRAIVQVCFDLGIDVIAEGVETKEEYSWLESEAVRLCQGYLFARPAFEALASAWYPERA